MALTYFKRYRMELDLAGRDLSRVPVLSGYQFLPWTKSLLEAHATASFLSFRDTLDANVFPCFTDLAGCRRLITGISRKAGFLREATWLAVAVGDDGDPLESCGTVQGIRDRFGLGAIQNLGITPSHRRRGLATALLVRALAGFRQTGVRRVYLEVTADNDAAVRLYRRHGFRVMKTLFKAAEVACP